MIALLKNPRSFAKRDLYVFYPTSQFQIRNALYSPSLQAYGVFTRDSRRSLVRDNVDGLRMTWFKVVSYYVIDSRTRVIHFSVANVTLNVFTRKYVLQIKRRPNASDVRRSPPIPFTSSRESRATSI